MKYIFYNIMTSTSHFIFKLKLSMIIIFFTNLSNRLNSDLLFTITVEWILFRYFFYNTKLCLYHLFENTRVDDKNKKIPL